MAGVILDMVAQIIVFAKRCKNSCENCYNDVICYDCWLLVWTLAGADKGGFEVGDSHPGERDLYLVLECKSSKNCYLGHCIHRETSLRIIVYFKIRFTLWRWDRSTLHWSLIRRPYGWIRKAIPWLASRSLDFCHEVCVRVWDWSCTTMSTWCKRSLSQADARADSRFGCPIRLNFPLLRWSVRVHLFSSPCFLSIMNTFLHTWDKISSNWSLDKTCESLIHAWFASFSILLICVSLMFFWCHSDKRLAVFHTEVQLPLIKNDACASLTFAISCSFHLNLFKGLPIAFFFLIWLPTYL